MLWRATEDIPELWDNASLFNVYHKLLIIASRPDWRVTGAWHKLAARLHVAPNTLRTAVAELAKIGLLQAGQNERGITQLTFVWGNAEPDLRPVVDISGAPGREADEMVQARKTALAGVSKNDTPEKGISEFDRQDVSKGDTALNMNKQEVTTGKRTTTPYNPPERLPFGFAEFWLAYPSGKGKQRAIKRWRRGHFSLEDILPVLGRQKRLRSWVKNDGVFVPRADVYLQRRAWEDDVPDDAQEEFFILNIQQPKTERDIVVRQWLDATSPDLLRADNNKINSVFETDRQLFEEIISLCGGDVKQAQRVMLHGWKNGCHSLRSIREKTPGYLDELKKGKTRR